MRFLVDVCAGSKLAGWLREMGHDVVEVKSINCRMADDEVMAWGAREGRVIITLDKDFGQLAVATGTARASIVRLPDIPFEERKRVLAAVLARYKEDLEKGSIITATEKRIRVRKLTAGY